MAASRQVRRATARQAAAVQKSQALIAHRVETRTAKNLPKFTRRELARMSYPTSKYLEPKKTRRDYLAEAEARERKQTGALAGIRNAAIAVAGVASSLARFA